MFPILLGKNNDLEKRVKTLEDSGGGGGSSGDSVLVVTDNDGTLDKTWQEINDASFAVIKWNNSENDKRYLYITRIMVAGDYSYQIMVTGDDVYEANSANGYPVIIS